MYINWSAVSALNNSLLKLLVVQTKEEQIIAGLQLGFPHLFTETPNEQQDGPWPLSVMQRIVAVSMTRGESDASVAENTLKQAGIYAPQVLIAGPTAANLFEGSVVADEEDATMIIGARSGKVDKDIFPFNLDRFEIGGIEYYLGYLSWEGEKVDDLQCFVVVGWPCGSIDESA